MRGVITALREELALADCSRRKVAAVIVLNDAIVGRGHNGLPEGSCLDGQCPRGKLSYAQQPRDVGYEESGCKAIHAEVAAMASAGPFAYGATILISEEPCPGCQTEMDRYGIADVYVVDFNHPVFTGKIVAPV